MLYKLHRKHLQTFLICYYEYLPRTTSEKTEKHDTQLKGSKGGRAKLTKKK
jgi:hypothetical protein